MRKLAFMITSAIVGVALAACQPGPAEKSGEAADSAYENATQGEKNMTDGPMENAGEAVDAANKAAQDAAKDATTTPDSTTPQEQPKNPPT